MLDMLCCQLSARVRGVGTPFPTHTVTAAMLLLFQPCYSYLQVRKERQDLVVRLEPLMQKEASRVHTTASTQDHIDITQCAQKLNRNLLRERWAEIKFAFLFHLRIHNLVLPWRFAAIPQVHHVPCVSSVVPPYPGR